MADHKKNCACGCDHDHEAHTHHEHKESCCCGHHHEEHEHEHTCSCSHDHHEHHHDHEESCCCGHHHEEHEHTCSCGHDHHEHHHDHGCGCGCHDHGHDDGCGCGCGHDHAHTPAWLLPTAAVLFVIGMVMEHAFHQPITVIAPVFAAAAVIAGYSVFWDGFKSLIKFSFTENVLMSIAVITAFLMGEFGEAAAVAILFNLGEMAEGIAEKRSRRSIAALTEIRPDTARVLRDGAEVIVSPAEVHVGDAVVVNPFERIPLDGTILEGTSYIDNAALTGESVPVEVAVGDAVLSGGVNGSAKLILRVTSAFEDSTASRILRMIEESSARKGNAEKLIRRFARVYTPIVLVLAILVAVIPPLFRLGVFSTWLYRALTMLVASCPCALVISVPLGFFAGIGVQSKAGMLIKGGKYLEALSKTETVVLDKTGTVTTGELSVSSVWAADGVTESDVLYFAAAAEARSAHPVAKAILAAAGIVSEADEIEEIAGHGIRACVDGKTVLVGRKMFLEENDVKTENVPDCTTAVAVDGRCIGAITLTDTVKADSKEAINALKELGVKQIVMLTGDNTQTAQAVAEQVGITDVYAGLLPQDKAVMVEEMQGVRVFVGDGVNDAPVLAAADCGVAVGLGSQAAIETADAVLSGGSLALLPRAIRLAKRCMGVIYFNIVFALAIKAAVLICTPLGFVPMWMGVFADVGVMALTVLNTLRILHFKAK